jgi:hypothetical protein
VATSEQTGLRKGNLKSNRRWLIGSIVSGIFPFLLYYFQGIFSLMPWPELDEQSAELFNYIFVALVFMVPAVVCLAAVVKLYKWWKLVPIAMLLFNAVLMLLFIALATWDSATW